MDIIAVICLGLFCISLLLLDAKRRSPRNPRRNPSDLNPFFKRGKRISESFQGKLFIYGFLIRFGVVIIFNITNAIRVLHLSPDSLRYHREGVLIAHRMALGDFNWPNWIDNGWFQFTGLIYYLFEPNPLLIQLINITLGSITPIIVYKAMQKVYEDERVARWCALFTAFFPSFVYWSCLMLKDPLSIFAMSLLVLSVVSLRNRFQVMWLFPMFLSLLIILGIREYLFFVCTFLGAISFVPVTQRHAGSLLIKLLLMILLIGTISFYMGYGFMGKEYILESHYFDIEYINQTRINMGDHGSGAFFKDPSVALWGSDFWSNFRASVVGIFFFFFTLDLTNLGSIRQLMALPEILLFISFLPALWRGMLNSWRNHRHTTLPIFVFAIGILIVYGSATTNMGAMFRWRMQAMPFFLAFISHGFILRSHSFYFRLFNRIRI